MFSCLMSLLCYAVWCHCSVQLSDVIAMLRCLMSLQCSAVWCHFSVQLSDVIAVFSCLMSSHCSFSWCHSLSMCQINPYFQISLKSVQWEQSCSVRRDGQTDGHDESKSRFSWFCESAWTVTVSVYCNSLLVFVAEMQRVYCAVRTGRLNVIQVTFCMYRLIATVCWVQKLQQCAGYRNCNSVLDTEIITMCWIQKL